MTRRKQRTTTIADMIILVIGSALAFASWRFISSMPIWNGFPDSLQWYHFQALGTVAFLVPFSLTLLAVALRKPRPRFRHVVSEPACVVGFSTLFVFVANSLLLIALMVLAGWSASTFRDGKVLYYCRLLAEQTGMAIGSACFIQALTCRHRLPAGWIDIAAWILAACWIMLAVSSAAFTLL